MTLHRTVILNSFQDPGAVSGHKDGVREAGGRAWILKRVQDDIGIDGGIVGHSAC